jgi:hypothetical protein
MLKIQTIVAMGARVLRYFAGSRVFLRQKTDLAVVWLQITAKSAKPVSLAGRDFGTANSG